MPPPSLTPRTRPPWVAGAFRAVRRASLWFGLAAGPGWLWVLLVGAALPVRVPWLGRSVSLFDGCAVVMAIPAIVRVRRHGWPRLPAPYLWLGGLLVVLGALSLLWTTDREASLIQLVADLEALWVMAAAMILVGSTDEQGVVRCLQGFSVLLVIPGVLLWLRVPGFLPPAQLDPSSGDYWSYFVRLSHPFIGRSNNLAALLLPMVIPLANWALRTRRALDVACAFACAVALVLTVSRGALAALVVVVAVQLLVDRRRRRVALRALGWLVPIVLAAAVLGALNPATRELIATRLSPANVDARWELLAQFWAAFGQHWVLGSGSGTGPDVHNTFAQQLLSFGLFGGLAIVAALVATGWWWFRRNPLVRPVLSRVYGLGVVALLGSLAVEASFEGKLLRPLIFLVWGLLVAGVTRPSARFVRRAALKRGDAGIHAPEPSARH